MRKKLLHAGILSIGLMTVGVREGQSQSVAYLPKPPAAVSGQSLKRTLDWRITGKVTSEKGEALPGVTVVVKSTTTGTTTNADGVYTITVSEMAGTLVFSYIGYASQERPYANATTMDVSLVEGINSLNEVVVTGYVKEEKKDIIGSVSIISAKDLLATPSGNVTNQLQGRSPGVTVSTDGSPGSVAKVRIRGFGSFGGSDPLYIIDGVPSVTGVNSLNPNDIESLQVLKDAASASVYGSRGANGVVIITTKKGKSGPPKISIDTYYGSNFADKSKFPALLNTQQYGEYYWKAMRGAGLKLGDAAWGNQQYGFGENPVTPEYIYVNNNGTKYGGAALEGLKTSNPSLFASLTDPAGYNFATHQIVKAANTNWFNEVFRNAPQQNYQISASVGSDYGSYALSVNYFDQQSIATASSFYKRYSLRANSSFNVSKRIRLGENVQLSYTKNNLFSVVSNNGTNVASAYVMESIIPVYDIAGNPAGSAAPGLVGVIDNGVGYNPVTQPYRHRFDNTASYGIFGNAYAEVDIIKGLTLRTSFGTDYQNQSTRYFDPITYEHYQNNTTNTLTQSTGNNNAWTWTNTLNYATTIAGKHTIKVLAGTEAIRTYGENLSATRLNYSQENDPNFLIVSAGVGTQTNSGSFNRNSLSSVFARADYSFDDKYLFNATLRRDESSRFAVNNRAGYFPAAAAGWRISSENFMKPLSWISDLKLRASWGIIGNQNGLSNENQYNVYVADLAQTYPITGSNTLAANSYTTSRIGNPNAKWEQNITTNLGVDASLFNNSLDVTVEVYNKQTKGLLVPQQLPLTGVTIPTANLPFINAGNVTNKGIDIGITKRGTVAGGLRYEAGLTFSRYVNTVTKVLDNPEATIIGGNTREGNVNLTKAGNPLSYFYGYQIDGFFNSQEEVTTYTSRIKSTWLQPAVGRWKIKDVNGDGIVNSLDRTYLGSPHPKFQLGMNVALNYRNFDLTGFLFWNYGNSIYNQARYNTDFNTFAFNRSTRMLNESWTPELGNNAKLPKLDINDTYSNANVTSYFVESASYLRLKNLQLGYSFPKVLVDRLKLSRLRVYVQTQNLFTITKFSGLDPDASFYGGGQGTASTSDISMGVVNGTTPTPKQLLFGLNLGF